MDTCKLCGRPTANPETGQIGGDICHDCMIGLAVEGEIREVSLVAVADDEPVKRLPERGAMGRGVG